MEEQKRFLNFNKDEIDLLVSLVEKYSSILECKKSDSVEWKRKNELETYKRGGGQPTPIKIDQNDLKVKSIIGVGVTGLPNPFDSDGPLIPLRSENDIEIIVDCNDEQIADLLNKSNNLEKTVNNNDENEQIQWDKWSPEDLKKPKSEQLQTNESRKKNSIITTSKRKSSRSTQLTNDCRTKINLVSQAKLELIKLQTKCLQEEHQIKLKEYQIKAKNVEELHKLEIEEKKIQIEILKKKLESI
ncbi:hypothetical protein ABEB36_015175 [Hypothenemus hampei]|uniref:Regulatory protein zeste n=1 Tax=Hypothenemus hampei TaxID=57062 RepID=A0ABD1E0X7_HYPHA